MNDNDWLESHLAPLRELIEALQEENQKLRDRVTALERENESRDDYEAEQREQCQ